MHYVLQQSLLPGGTRERNNTPAALVALVVTYNRLTKLKDTIHALLSAPAEVLDYVVVVDNASDDGTDAWLTSIVDKRLLVIRMDQNMGGAGGFDRGLREIKAAFDPDWVVVMDDDGRPAPGALKSFRTRVKTQNCDAVAAAVRYPDGRICEMNRPSHNPFWHWRVFGKTVRGGRGGFHLAPQDYEAEPQYVDVASFVGLFLSRRAVDLAGFPDPSFFVYAEDGLYTLGLTRAGGKILFDPAVRFDHDMASIDPGERRLKPMWKVYYYHRNLLTLYRAAAGVLFWPIVPLVLMKWRARGRDYGVDRAIFDKLLSRAISDGLANRRELSFEDVKRLSKPETGMES